MGKIILNLAMSVDGYIADENGGYAWIAGDGDASHDSAEKFDFEAFVGGVGTVVMGRKAYEDCIDDAPYLEGKTIIKATRSTHPNIVAEVIALAKQDEKNIWLFGGGELVHEFIQADAVDEYIIGIIPILLGSGRKLFVSETAIIPLALTHHYIDSGMTILRYVRRGLKKQLV